MNKNERKYIIFGAGRYGEEALLYYGIRNVAYFCDNKKYGTEIKGIEVVDFETLVEIWKDYQVVLAVQRKECYAQMSAQLKQANISYEEFHSLEKMQQEDNFFGKYEFTDRSTGSKKLLMILAGYKEYLWGSVFPRVYQYVPKDIDVCVMTAGYRNETLEKICEKNRWSYLFTYENKLSLTQNLTIRSHPVAEWIYKMDEDIFVTPGMFEEMMHQYENVTKQGLYSVGLVAPVMQVNSYGYNRVLEYCDCREEYERQFGMAKYGVGEIYGNEKVAEYLWDKTLPINEFADKLRNQGKDFSICFHRFGIGCILFARKTWEKMGGFKIAPEGVLGVDEEYMCRFFMNAYFAIIVAEKAFAGHFGYGAQTEHMRKIYEKRKQDFDR